MQQPRSAGRWAGIAAVAAVLGACGPDEPLPQQGPAEHGGRAYASPAPAAAGQPAPAVSAADKLIVERVRAELAHDPAVRDLDIKVRGADGRVYLHGFVTSSMQKTRAAEIAQTVEGVTSIENSLIPRARSGAAQGPLAEARLYL